MCNYVCLKDFEDHAKTLIKKEVFDYFENGAVQQQTKIQNTEKFSNYKIKPRFLRGIKERNKTISILGENISIPIGISPTAYHKFVDDEGECVTARAAEKHETIYTLSTHAHCTVENVLNAAPKGVKWMQMYIFNKRELILEFIKKAEEFNFKALVVTIDAPVFCVGLDTLRNKTQFPTENELGVLKEFWKKGLFEDAETFVKTSAKWEDLQFIKHNTNLPIVVKGILTPEDAILAVESGADAILVSNHGGRHLDETESTIEALPKIVKAVGHQVDIYMDGGIRTGSDVFKALALGAKMVFIGRPILWGLACQGEEGVSKVLQLLTDEFDHVMTFTGCSKLSDITSNRVIHKYGQHKF